MRGVVEVGKQPAVDVRMQRDDAVPEHLGDARDIRDLGDGQARLAQRTSGVAARHELPSEIVEAAPQVDDAGLVVHGQQRPHDTSSMSVRIAAG